jgi:hypothetical protein
MTKKVTLSVLCFFLGLCCFAQTRATDKKEREKAEKKPVSHEIGLNVTNLLTDLLGNNNRTEPGAYLLSYKRVSGDNALRVGVTTNFALKKENTLSFNTQLINQNFQLRVGYEKRHSLSPRFLYYFGIDAVAGYKQEQSNATTSSLNVLQTDLIATGGVGPVLGFQFAVFDKLIVGTEGSLYATYYQSSTRFKNVGSTAVFPTKEATGMTAQTNLPKFLFLIVKF